MPFHTPGEVPATEMPPGVVQRLAHLDPGCHLPWVWARERDSNAQAYL